MRTNYMALWLLAAWLAGCAQQQPVDMLPMVDPAGSGPKAETQALEADQIRKDYDDCIKKLGPQDASCQELQWMYDDVKERFDAAAARKKAP
jgi:hypothetical protein